MIRVLVVAAVLASATACGSHPDPGTPGTGIDGLVAKLKPVMSCGKPADSYGAMRADCAGGQAFVEAYPEAGGEKYGIDQVAASFGGDVLVGDRWIARADTPDMLSQMRRQLGGRVVHVKPRVASPSDAG